MLIAFCINTQVTCSLHLVSILKSKHHLLPNSPLFTMDTKSMYSNIDTQHAKLEITNYLQEQNFNRMYNIDTNAVIGALHIIMRHSMFTFNNDIYTQLTSTAMVAPPAPMYTMLYYNIHKCYI
jgi:hypothetical protein